MLAEIRLSAALRHCAAILVLAALCLALLSAPALAQGKGRGPLVLAAASLQESLGEAADSWARRGHPRPVISFAASSALARQIASGAPADLFISADEPWMDHVEKAGLIAPKTRVSFLANRLVLVAPAGSKARLAIGPRFPLARALGEGRLAMADPDSVPAGKYGKASLEKLGVWKAVSPKIARAENVRAALALVERGEAPFGIVYATDAKASAKVRVIGQFPASSHPPITYPLARLKSSTNPEAEAFRRFLVSPAGKAIFVRHGFAAR
ncbi:molybdate ABC transporter substrate-binding protein [Tsuneonella sp. CC-YZS046]|uniref:molybdate ABC transporter substrate-binding protein n=1 Tax=Tsuneonella sp. CC-YZS046 TaxID=3042152 RepID=UPI002D796A6A|nr:molybdate ABC transporter substrate-binding protein [Tsuneonella sp. CC-YZS046]WRO66639.1 molybdate ABC transporter substrate-binding protein [Tsuneonella sp. CC-YZS046]